MYMVKTSPRALLVALFPLAAVHAVLLAMGLLETQTLPPQAALPAPDRILALFVASVALDGALLFAGHLVLRQRAMSSRLEYALMGAAMAASSYAIALQNGILLSPPPPGSEVTAGLLPSIAGLIAGFLYGQFAGLEPTGSAPQFASEALNASRKFAGPVRVRTSIAAIVIASTIPAALSAILAFSLTWPFLSNDMVVGSASIFAAALPAQLFITLLIATTLPSVIVVLVAHHIARALNRSSGIVYSMAGSGIGAVFAVVTLPFSPFTAGTLYLSLAAVYGALMGAMYRRFAGLEPVPLPEAVLATDPDALVEADHPSRRMHSVVMTQ